jgi:molybdate transport system regulatory protein
MPIRLTLRLDFSNGHRLGPGKVRLLEAIDQHGSISAAGRALGMSYRRAWLLVMRSTAPSPSPPSPARPAAAAAAARR